MFKKSSSALSLNHLEEKHLPDDRNFQEFKLFVSNKKIIAEINTLRSKKKISPCHIKSRLLKINTLLEDLGCLETGLDVKPEKLIELQEIYNSKKIRKECEEKISRLHRYVSSRINNKHIEAFLKKYNKPFSWSDSLAGFILTGVVRAPCPPYEINLIENGVELKMFPGINWTTYLKAIDIIQGLKFQEKSNNRYKVYIKNNSVVLEMDGKGRSAGLRQQYKKVIKLLLGLSGADIKNKRRKKLDEHLIVALEEKYLRKTPLYGGGGYDALNRKRSKRVYSGGEKSRFT